MQKSEVKFDFPNPLKYLDIEDEPVKLKYLMSCIEPGTVTIVSCENGVDFESFIKKISIYKAVLVLNNWLFGYGILKRIAQRKNKAIILRSTAKKLNKIQKNKKFATQVGCAIKLNHKPYYYIAGCKNKENTFDVGWTVIGVNVIKGR